MRPAAFAACASVLVLAGCGGTARSTTTSAAERTLQRERRAVEAAIAAGRLPPIARQVFTPDGRITYDFIDGDSYDHDVIHTRDHGLRGTKLQWDFNGDGRLSADERTITEASLMSEIHRYTKPGETAIEEFSKADG
jgi:hypothetical protein